MDPDEKYWDFSSEDIAYFLTGAKAVCVVGLAVCWLFWFFRVRVIAEKFAPGRLRYRPLMAVAGWFIPVANLFLPKQIANDVWHASSWAGKMDPAGALHAWWCAWIATLLTWPFFWIPWTETVAGTGGYMDDGVYLPYNYVFAPLTWMNMAANLLVLPTMVVTALFMDRLTAMQVTKLAGTRSGHEIVTITFANLEADLDEGDEITVTVQMTHSEARAFRAGAIAVVDDPERWGIKIPDHWHSVMWDQVDP